MASFLDVFDAHDIHTASPDEFIYPLTFPRNTQLMVFLDETEYRVRADTDDSFCVYPPCAPNVFNALVTQYMRINEQGYAESHISCYRHYDWYAISGDLTKSEVKDPAVEIMLRVLNKAMRMVADAIRTQSLGYEITVATFNGEVKELAEKEQMEALIAKMQIVN